MATEISPAKPEREFGSYEYPTRDGRPMGESDLHRNVMVETIQTLQAFYAGQPVYVSGNLLLFYRRGDKRRHISPDVLVVKGAIPGDRLNYLLWEEGRAPQVVIEITSPSTRKEDLQKKFELYRSELRVREYFLFDPKDEYLKPRLQGYRLIDEQYVPIEPVASRLPSEELQLHLESAGTRLRLYDPPSGRWLPTLQELQELAEARSERIEQENERLRQELNDLRRTRGR